MLMSVVVSLERSCGVECGDACRQVA